MKKTLTACAASVVLGLSGTASAQIYLTDVQLNEILTEGKVYSGTLDGVKAGQTVRFMVLGPRNFAYAIEGSEDVYQFDGEIGRSGGRPNGNPALNYRQPDNYDVRFEWLGDGTVKFEFWEPGNKAGQRQNNPADAKTTLAIMTAEEPATTPAEPVTAERKEAREAATEILPVGAYAWAPFDSTLKMQQGGAFSEATRTGTTDGYFIKSGSELCFDITNGYCYEVEGPNDDGVFTLIAVGKMLNSDHTNRRAGQRTTLTPAE